MFLKEMLSYIDVICDDKVIFQRLDYLNVPFRFDYCHKARHLMSSCTSLLHGYSRPKGFHLSDPLSHSPHVDSPSGKDNVALSLVGMYGSLSLTLYNDFMKGELLYIEDVENCTRMSLPTRSMDT